MSKIVDCFGTEYEFEGCLGCALQSQISGAGGGVIAESKHFYVRQDTELPINGFIIVAPKRHVEKFAELTTAEQQELAGLVGKLLKLLENNKGLDLPSEYNIVAEEKQGYHLHFWLMPRHDWMIKKFGKPLKNLSEIQSYALENLRNEENFRQIKATIQYLKDNLK